MSGLNMKAYLSMFIQLCSVMTSVHAVRVLTFRALKTEDIIQLNLLVTNLILQARESHAHKDEPMAMLEKLGEFLDEEMMQRGATEALKLDLFAGDPSLN